MKRILVIHTGGTIGMVATPSGYAPEKAAFHELLDRIRMERNMRGEITV